MNLELNCANFVDEGKGIDIPPKNAKTYPTKINTRALKDYIQKGGEILVITAENGREVENVRG